MTKNTSKKSNSKTDSKDIKKKAAKTTVMPKKRTSAQEIFDRDIDVHKKETTRDNPVPANNRKK